MVVVGVDVADQRIVGLCKQRNTQVDANGSLWPASLNWLAAVGPPAGSLRIVLFSSAQ